MNTKLQTMMIATFKTTHKQAAFAYDDVKEAWKEYKETAYLADLQKAVSDVIYQTLESGGESGVKWVNDSNIDKLYSFISEIMNDEGYER